MPPAFTFSTDDYAYDEATHTLKCRRCGTLLGPAYPDSDPAASHALMDRHDDQCQHPTAPAQQDEPPGLNVMRNTYLFSWDKVSHVVRRTSGRLSIHFAGEDDYVLVDHERAESVFDSYRRWLQATKPLAHVAIEE